MTQRLDVFQSMWAMEQRRPDGKERSPKEAVAMIAEAGYAGIDLVSTTDYADARDQWIEAIKDTDLDVSFVAFCSETDPLEPTIEAACKIRERVRYINLIPRTLYWDVDEAAMWMGKWIALGAAEGIPVYLETHRQSMTTDLLFTTRLVNRMPELKLVADLSHVMTGQEWSFPPLTYEEETMVEHLLRRAESFQGRIASAQHIQISPDFAQNQVWVDIFKGWWTKGLGWWRERHDDDAACVFLCELGPPDYAITGADGWELSDRWTDALTIKGWAEDIWQGLEVEKNDA
jgi:hypothetical protein